MLENYSLEELRELGGREVLDANGESVGYVDLVFVDDATGRPE
jgi:sporulation protein YlmC with PRC-barrel domain